MFLKKYKPTIPSKRFSYIYINYLPLKLKLNNFIFFKKFYSSERTNLKHKNNLYLKKLKKNKYLNIFTNLLWRKKFISTTIFYSLNWRKEFIHYKTLFNFSINLPSTEISAVGKKYSLTLLNLFFSSLDLRFALLMPLLLIPLTFTFSYIQFKYKKFTFAKSSGTFCMRHEAIKTSKLEAIVLPSKQIKYVKNTTLCLLGSTIDLNFKNFVFGKYGSKFKKKYKTHVRGVAMNPVDHPNGGRTKSAQPEKTPWGKIAKCSH